MRTDILGDNGVCVPLEVTREVITPKKEVIEENATETMSKIVECVEKVSPPNQNHLLAIKKMIDNCTEEEASYICESMAVNYPLIMMDALSDRINTLTGILNDFKKQIRSV